MATASPIAIPEDVLRSTARWVHDFHDYWYTDLPREMHLGPDQIGRGGVPDFHPDFARWLDARSYEGSKPRNPDVRLRTTKAFRKLRKRAIREFEVCLRIIVYRESPSATAEWLTNRAIAGNHPERYTVREVLLLLISGVEKMVSWW